MKIKKGTILTLESGNYSDFAYSGPFVAIREFDQKEVCDLFSTVPRNSIHASEFVAWLAREGYIIDDNSAVRWYLGEYEFDPDIADDAKCS